MADLTSAAEPVASLVNFTETYSGPLALFSTHATRALADSKYDKRKSGALEVEGYVKALVLEQKRSGIPCTEGVAKVCRRLANDFVLASDPNKRKGGMIGMAAVAIGLGSEVGKYCELLLPAVLKCFEDPEAKVRYFAIEAMFNIAKVSRQALLRPSVSRFNPIYHGLCKVFADVDPEVKHGAVLLDRQLKSLVSEANVGEFDLDGAVDLFHGYLKVKNPFIRQLLVSWICHLDSVPDLLIVTRLPLLLDGLLDMLSDSNKSIRDSVEVCLNAFLLEIGDLVRNSSPDNTRDALQLLHTIVNILLQRRLDAHCRQVRQTCLHWLGELVCFFGKQYLQASFYEFLKAVLDSVAEADEEAIRLGNRLDVELTRHFQLSSCELDEENLIKVCIAYLPHVSKQVRAICLNWIALLLDNQHHREPQPSNQSIIDRLVLIDGLVTCLNDVEDSVVMQSISALARIARNTQNNALILTKVLDKFRLDRSLLELRGPFIIRQLCVLLQPTPVYLVFASLLVSEELGFVSLMVQTLNVILLTTPELVKLRQELKVNHDLFDQVFQAWCHNPISALALTLLSGAYELAGSLVNVLSTVEVTVELLVDADRLVRLLESPVFLHVRMDLLKSGQGFEPDLLKSLFGLLMLLPQRSEAFVMLNARLSAVTSMHISLNGNPHRILEGNKDQDVRFAKLCGDFTKTQDQHQQYRMQQLLDKSLT
ncbi:hypothetical protein BASA81_000200 [Batrachochytrium salamandrivorans]|nr:hypothetical protein BASA81_000200 [Batrachochytrium salamandrivorans]